MGNSGRARIDWVGYPANSSTLVRAQGSSLESRERPDRLFGISSPPHAALPPLRESRSSGEPLKPDQGGSSWL